MWWEKILIPVERLTKLHENEEQTSAILKGISVIIKGNNNTDKMIITFLRKEIQLQESINSNSLKSYSIINNARKIPPHIPFPVSHARAEPNCISFSAMLA